MSKRKIKKINEKEKKYKTKRNSIVEKGKKYTSQRKSKSKKVKSNPALKKRKNSYSATSLDYFEINKRKVLLANELLEEAKKIKGDKISPDIFLKAIKIYDIDNDMNYKYLDCLKNITKRHYKYIYTFCFDNRKKIIEKHKIKRKIFSKSSKLLLMELVDFLIKKFRQDKESSKELMTYNLVDFEKYIIPIYEGNDELKYYYFISIILGQIKNNKKKVPIYLNYFKEFFKKEKNLDKIEYVFYAIFRIDLLILYPNQADKSSLSEVNLMINEDINHKIEGLKLIKDRIKEDINKIKINDNTILTLKDNDYKFKPIDYYFGSGIRDMNSNNIIDLIISKEYMTYHYNIKERFNCFNNEKKSKAFFNYFKKILSSQVIREFFQNVKSFKNFEFQLNNKKIVDYLLGKIICSVFNRGYWGMANREGFGIFINKNMNDEESFGLNYGGYLITNSHEVVNHGLRNLINSNSGIKASTETPNQSFINDEDNYITKNLKDGGEKFETLLFGTTNPILTIGGNHFLFNINNWNTSLEKFKKGFKDNNISKSVKILKNELEFLKKDNNVKEIFSDINYDNIKSDCETPSLQTRKGFVRHLRSSEFA